MTLCDTVRNFGSKITPNYRETRYCSFAAPEETVGVIDLSPAGNGSRGLAFMTDRLMIKLGESVQQIYYSDIRVMELLPSYETPFEDELLIGSPSGEIRISDCALNKFFLRQLISNVARISVTMKDDNREALYSQLTAEALDYYAGEINTPVRDSQPKQPQPSEPEERPEPLPEAAAAVQEIAAAKKAALAAVQSSNSIELTEEKIQWISGKQPEIPVAKPEVLPERTELPEFPQKEPELVPANAGDEDITDMTREQTMSYLLDSIAEINSESEQPEESAEPEAVQNAEQTEEPTLEPVQQEEPPAAEPSYHYTIEPDSDDIYIQASRRIRELCEDGRLTMEQVNAAVKEQLVSASELYSTLDIESAPLPPTVKGHALRLSAAADRLPEYFALGEDIAARVMFFMLYQMLSYTDRIVQSDETKQSLNYFFVRFGAAGMILSMLDANN